jgi:hypothetical protein
VRQAVIIRVVASLLLGLLTGVIISEISFRTQSNLSRSPRTIELVIPAGTAEKASQGISLIPADMTFVQGDVLSVKNLDNVTHTLGTLYIPAGSTTSLTLNQPGNLVVNCSFRPNRTFGINVSEALTWSTRIQGIILSGMPLGIMLGLYSLVVWPLNEPKKKT